MNDEERRWSAGHAVGVSLLGAAAPVGPFFLSLRPSITVLYGLNGAGKSQVLRLLTAALGGPPVPGASPLLHVELDEPDGEHQVGIASVVADGLDRWVASLEPFDAADWEGRFGRVGVPGQVVRGALADSTSYSDVPLELAQQVAAQGAFVINAGDRVVSPSIRLDELAGPLAEAWDSARRQLAALPEDGRWPEDQEAFPPHAVNRALLAAARHYPPVGVDGPTPPSWMSWPIALPAGRWTPGLVRGAWLPIVTEATVVQDVLEQAARPLIAASKVVLQEGAVELSGPLAEWLEALGAAATRMSRTCLPQAPQLRCSLREPYAQDGAVVQVRAADAPSGTWVELEALSHAEQRWARLALQLAVRKLDTSPGAQERAYLIIDEPDAALHPAARRHLARGLTRLAATVPATVVAATHAAELLSPGYGDLRHVQRQESGLAAVVPVDVDFVREWQAQPRLGLDTVDLPQLVKVFLVVEGAHDEAVLGIWLEDALRAAAARMLALRGSSNISTLLDCELLFQFTEASVMVVLDNTRAPLVDLWEQVSRVASLQGPSNAHAKFESERARLKSLWGKVSQEEQKLFRLIASAIDSPYRGRLSFSTLAHSDILNYLPAHEILPRVWSWEQARQMAGDAARTETDFKAWMKSRGVVLTAAHLAEVAARTPVPPDVQKVALRLEALAGVASFP